MTTGSQRWVAPLTPAPNLTVDNLLELLSGIDVWERHMGYLVAAASDLRLADFEARGSRTSGKALHKGRRAVQAFCRQATLLC